MERESGVKGRFSSSPSPFTSALVKEGHSSIQGIGVTYRKRQFRKRELGKVHKNRKESRYGPEAGNSLNFPPSF